MCSAPPCRGGNSEECLSHGLCVPRNRARQRGGSPSEFPGGKHRVQPKGFFSSGPGAGRDVYALRVLTVGRATRSGTTGMPCLTGSKSERLDCSAGELGFLNQPAIAPEASIVDRSDRPAPGQELRGRTRNLSMRKSSLSPFSPNLTKAESNERFL